MLIIVQYILKLTLSLSLLYLFYQILLRKLTFYGWNRWYLLGYALLSFIIPFINVTPIIERQEFKNLKIIDYIPQLGDIIGKPAIEVPTIHVARVLSSLDIISLVMVAGSLIMLVRLCIQLYSILKMKSKAQLLNEEGCCIFQVDKNVIPFSFGNAIYLNRELHSENELKQIILHEYVHVRQRHSIDIMVAEMICVVNWINPFAWHLRYSIRQNLEFIADNQLLQKGLDKKAYQYHLLKVIGTPLYQIANGFNLSALKKRIVMMNTMKSTKKQLLKFLFLLPLFVFLLISLRERGTNESSVFKDKKSILNSITANTFAGFQGDDEIVYRDESIVKDGIMNWRISKEYQRKLLYLINGKPIGKNEKMVEPGKDQFFIMEVAFRGKILNSFGPDAKDGLVNFVTVSHKNIENAYIFHERGLYSAEKIKAMQADAVTMNMLFIGMDNPLRISVEDISAEDLFVNMDANYGKVLKRSNGLFLVQPEKPGNVELKVFRKQSNGALQYIYSRFFRVSSCLPEHSGSMVFSNS